MAQQVYLSPSDIASVIKLAPEARIKGVTFFEIVGVNLQKGEHTWGVHLEYHLPTNTLHLKWYKDNGGDVVNYPIQEGTIDKVCTDFNLMCIDHWNQYITYQIEDLLENQ